MSRLKRLLAVLTVVAPGAVLAGCANSGVDLSSDGKSVAMSHDGSLWLADIEKEGWREVPVDGKVIGAPSWSPTGRHVLFRLLEEPQQAAETSAGNGSQEEAQQPDRICAYDTVDHSTSKLGAGVGGPFAWREDGSRFLAVHSEDGHLDLRWYETNGTQVGHLSVPEEVKSVSQVVLLDDADELAFIGLHQAGNRIESDVYLSRNGAVERVSKTGDVGGLGLQAGTGRLIWARATPVAKGVALGLAAYDLASRRMVMVPLPEKFSTIPAERDFLPNVNSIIFSPNGARLAIVADYAQVRTRDDTETHSYSACYNVETDGSGASLIRRTGPDEGTGLAPAWSKQGDRLAVLDTSGEEPKLLIYNADGTGKRMAALPKRSADAAN
jgi:Tol biopolymer transport system component